MNVINAIHMLIYTKDAEADRAFLRDVLGLPYVDDGHGWLIFKAPPAEIGVHPTDGAEQHQIMFMCDDVEATTGELAAKGIEVLRPVRDDGWGLTTSIRLPGGGEIDLYQPRHQKAYEL